MIDLKNILAIALISYLIGNFASAYILGKLLQNMDIRNYGSQNAGATNALRVFGKKIGALALLLDVLKGILAVYIGGKFLNLDGRLLAGIFVVLGHNYPVFLKFKGGKGIATSLGVILSLHWPTGLICILIGLLTIIKFKYVSLASIVGGSLVPFIGLIMRRPFDKGFFITLLILAIMAVYRHRSNIRRLINGEEYKIGERVNKG